MTAKSEFKELWIMYTQIKRINSREKKIMAKKFNFLARMKTKALGECALMNNKVVDNKL